MAVASGLGLFLRLIVAEGFDRLQPVISGRLSVRKHLLNLLRQALLAIPSSNILGRSEVLCADRKEAQELPWKQLRLKWRAEKEPQFCFCLACWIDDSSTGKRAKDLT